VTWYEALVNREAQREQRLLANYGEWARTPWAAHVTVKNIKQMFPERNAGGKRGAQVSRTP